MSDEGDNLALTQTAPGPIADSPPRERAPLGPGSSIKHYEIIRKLGQGGMGAVYLARSGAGAGGRASSPLQRSRTQTLPRRRQQGAGSLGRSVPHRRREAPRRAP